MIRGARRLRWACLSLSAALLCCASAKQGKPPVPAPELHAAYVVLTAPGSGPHAGKTVPFARLITAPDIPCPPLVATDGTRTPTTPRRDPHGFPVQVCEAVYPFERSLGVAGSGVRLPSVGRDPARVAVLADTGCKPKDQGGCPFDDPGQWPLPAFAAAAAAAAPDVVLHMGDYNYRGTSGRFEPKVPAGSDKTLWVYDAGDGAPPSARCEIYGPYYSQNSSDSADPDSWEAWKLDFFEPARPLLAAGWRGEVVALDAEEWTGLLPRCDARAAAGRPLCLRPAAEARRYPQPDHDNPPEER